MRRAWLGAAGFGRRPLGACGRVLGEAMVLLEATVVNVALPAEGPPGAVIATEFFSDEQGEITVFLPVAKPLKPVGRVAPTVLPATELATIVHRGSHDDVDRSYGALASYVSGRALAVTGPIRERYLVGRHDTPNEKRWRTEIGWPIFDTADSPE